MIKDVFIKVRVTAEDRQRYIAALAKDNRTLSDVVRASLERIAKRADKTQGPAE